MDDDKAKRIHRNAATLSYGEKRANSTQRFSPPPEASLPQTVLPAPRAAVQGTMAPSYQGSRKTGRGAFQLIVMTGLIAIAVVSNLDRLRSVWSKVSPPLDAVEVAVDGAIPMMMFVRSNPPKSRVFINGHLVGRTPFAQGYTSAGGTVRVKVESPGFQTWESDLVYTANGLVVNAQLHRANKLKPMLIVAMAKR
jgi:hypothetical protein